MEKMKMSETQINELVEEIIDYLKKYEFNEDVNIYANGKKFSFDMNGEVVIKDNENPRDYFEYVATEHIVSMSFEGALYDLLNGYLGSTSDFDAIFEKRGLYYELGDSWNLSVYFI